MESLIVSLLPPDVSALAAIGLVALSLFTSALTAAAAEGATLRDHDGPAVPPLARAHLVALAGAIHQR